MEILLIDGKDVPASYGGTGRTAAPRLRRIEFGDGYNQIAPDGINSNRLKLNLMFGKLTRAHRKIVSDFLNARGGAESFIWTPPPPYDNRVRAFRCETWNEDWEEWDCENVSAVFEEQFVSLPQVENVPEIFQADPSDGLTQISTSGLFDTPNYTATTVWGPITNVSDFSPWGDYSFYFHIIHTNSPFAQTFELNKDTGTLFDQAETNYQMGNSGGLNWSVFYFGAFHKYKRPRLLKYYYPRTVATFNALPTGL